MAARPEKVLLLINTGSRQGQELCTDIEDCLQQAGMTIDSCMAADPNELAERLRERCDQVDVVMVAGGDGTVSALLADLVDCDKPFALIPTGTANDLARTVGIPESPMAAVDIMLAGHQRRIDLGRLNGSYYVNVASVGLGAIAAREIDSDVKKHWGVFGYVHALFRLMKRRKPFWATIECDGDIHTLKTVHIGVGNGVYHAGGTRVHETAEIDDGKLDIYAMPHIPLWRWILMMPFLRFGMQGRFRDVWQASGESARITTRRPMPINTDGELTTETPASFSVARQALAIFAPAPNEDDHVSR